jgi:hypothetical protein
MCGPLIPYAIHITSTGYSPPISRRRIGAKSADACASVHG